MVIYFPILKGLHHHRKGMAADFLAKSWGCGGTAGIHGVWI